MDPQAAIAFAPGVLARAVGDDVVLVHLGTDRIYELNETAGRLWRLLAGGSSLAAARAVILDEFAVDALRLDEEIARTLLSWRDEGLVEGDDAVRIEAPASRAARGGDRPAEAWRAQWRDDTSLPIERRLTLAAPIGGATVAEEDGCRVIFAGSLHDRVALARKLGLPSPPAADDALTVLRGYRARGEALFGELRGPFAAVIADGRAGTLLAARDQVGAQPLFFAAGPGGISLSDSVEALRRGDATSPAATPDATVLAAHLCHHVLHDDTGYATIRRLPPGHTLRAGGGRVLASERYWAPGGVGDDVDWLGDDAQAHFERLFEQAVARALAEGPAGIHLSGGLDSVSVAAIAATLAAQNGQPPPRALSLAFPDPECDERERQTAVAAALGLPLTLLRFDDAVGPQGLLRSALALSEGGASPLVNFWRPAYDALDHEGRRLGVRTVLAGTGGDEWLSVSPFLAADLLRSWDLRGLADFFQVERASFHTPPLKLAGALLWTFGARPLVKQALARRLGHAPALREPVRRARADALIPAWVAPDPRVRRAVVDRMAAAVLEPTAGRFYLADMRLAYTHPVLSLEMEDTYQGDRRCDVRTLAPFWDVDLVEALFRIPPRALNAGGRSKGLVRDAVARRFPGLGFEAQRKVRSTKFFADRVFAEAGDALRARPKLSALAAAGIADEDAARRLFDATLLPDREMAAVALWELLSFEAWLRAHA